MTYLGKIQGQDIEVKPDETFAGHAFISPGQQKIVIEAEIGGDTRQILRRFVVKD